MKRISIKTVKEDQVPSALKHFNTVTLNKSTKQNNYSQYKFYCFIVRQYNCTAVNKYLLVLFD